MIELPEALTLGKQTDRVLKGKIVTDLFGPTNLHKFTFFNGSTDEYRSLLMGRKVKESVGKGIFVDVRFEDDMFLSLFDGINIRYGTSTDTIPEKYQLMITFNDQSFVYFTTTMYGGIYAFHKSTDNKYRTLSLESISPLEDEYTEECFNKFITSEKRNIPIKALLATEQRIPGVGNGVLQDILFNARIHPKRRIKTLNEIEKERLFQSLKSTLADMTLQGGRDTESDIFGQRGGYKTILSKNTYNNPCPRCGGTIIKESYMGGSVYYCPICQENS
ncbi:formamidopyrimidine-DNA glycosylase [Porphyromonadaceae bacterium]